MAGHKQNLKSRVVQVNSEESWDFYIAHARNQDCPEVAAKMQVRAMPTFLLMKEGAQVDKIVGANPNEIRKRIHKFIDSIRAHNI